MSGNNVKGKGTTRGCGGSRGASAVLGVRSAAAHWSVLRWRGPVEIITPTQRRPQPRLHPRCRRLHPRDVTTRGGLPVTTLARTYVDIAGLLTLDELDRDLRADLARRTGMAARLGRSA